MIGFLRRYQKPLFVGTIVTFLLGTFVGLGGYLFSSRDMASAVASVGKTKIPYSVFAARVNQYLDALRDRGTDVTDDVTKQVKQGMLRDMIVDELLAEKADQMGIVVTDAELARDIQNTPGFQRGGVFSQDVYYAAVRAVYHDTPESYEAMRRKQIKAMLLKQLIFQSAKLTPPEVRELYAQVNKGKMKDFEKDKDSFTARAQQQRALELINNYLRQLTAQVEIRSYLDQRESGS